VRRLTEKSEKFKQLSEERRSVSLLSFSWMSSEDCGVSLASLPGIPAIN
jgi:hypothetical protein